ncbi:hypothetical protein BDN71DRAFT_1498045 [Pleurotus eryngii]|uniref:Deoxyhypusine hydroxylase n=1 Tax=Pleurotus eryngii TaxID=5323 RepID=A0A9P5ZQ26_PLEER|nr:hypothetical protein BDN71DRAFT_1498045 [Pleurotus eryngii]
MVRHEAAEAMEAILASDSLPILKKYLDDAERTVRETCEIAIAKIEWDNSEEGKQHAHANSKAEDVRCSHIHLASGFSDDSALFKVCGLPNNTDNQAHALPPHRHEIAFVFGQMLSPHSVSSLIKLLENNGESEMMQDHHRWCR